MALNNEILSTIRNGRAVGNGTDTMVYNDQNSVSPFVYNKKKKPTDDTTGGATAGKDVFLPRFKKLVFMDLKSRLNVSGREIDALIDLGLTEEEADAELAQIASEGQVNGFAVDRMNMETAE